MRLLFLAIFLVYNFCNASPSKYLYQTEDDIVLGSNDAPVTIIDYSSFSCPTCAHFHNTVLPYLEEKYIKNGKVKLIFRSYVMQPIDLKASIIPLCAEKTRYYVFVKVLFNTQKNWASEASNSLESLEHIARLGGIFGDDLQRCFDDKSIEEKLIESRYIAQNELGVDATPSLIINGKLYKGLANKKKLFEIIDSELEANKK